MEIARAELKKVTRQIKNLQRKIDSYKPFPEYAGTIRDLQDELRDLRNRRKALLTVLT